MPKIMVVDDDKMVLRVITIMLEQEGYRVAGYSDAALALESDLDGVEVIITDLDMPMPGETFIQQVRRTSEVPIIAVSGNVSKERAQFLRNIGAQEVLPKPLSLPVFLESVKQLTAVQ
jgi:two-component system response regulator ChvI